MASWVAKQTALRNITNVDWWYCPDADAAAVAEQLKTRLGGRVLFDIHEAFDKGVIDRWFGGRAPLLVKWLVRRRIAQICRRADVVTGVNQTVLKGYGSRNGDVVVTRLCAPSFFSKGYGTPPEAPTGKMRVMHGKASAGVGTEQVLDGLEALRPEVMRGIEITLIRMPGYEKTFSVDFRKRVEAFRKNGQVDLVEPVPHMRMPALMASHNVGLIAAQRDFGVVALPNRLFEYMAAGLAIVAPSYSKEIVPIIENEKIGLLVDFEKPAEITGALEWLAAHPHEVAAMGQRARQAFLTTYNWDKEFEKLLQTMRAVESSVAV